MWTLRRVGPAKVTVHRIPDPDGTAACALKEHPAGARDLRAGPSSGDLEDLGDLECETGVGLASTHHPT